MAHRMPEAAVIVAGRLSSVNIQEYTKYSDFRILKNPSQDSLLMVRDRVYRVGEANMPCKKKGCIEGTVHRTN